MARKFCGNDNNSSNNNNNISSCSRSDSCNQSSHCIPLPTLPHTLVPLPSITQVVLVGGESGSGKTTLARRLCALLPDTRPFNQDDYYRSPEEVLNITPPSSINISLALHFSFFRV